MNSRTKHQTKLTHIFKDFLASRSTWFCFLRYANRLCKQPVPFSNLLINLINRISYLWPRRYVFGHAKLLSVVLTTKSAAYMTETYTIDGFSPGFPPLLQEVKGETGREQKRVIRFFYVYASVSCKENINVFVVVVDYSQITWLFG